MFEFDYIGLINLHFIVGIIEYIGKFARNVSLKTLTCDQVLVRCCSVYLQHIIQCLCCGGDSVESSLDLTLGWPLLEATKPREQRTALNDPRHASP